MEIKPFIKNCWSLTPLVAEHAPWFKGAEVITSLKYTNLRRALKKHVDEEDKKTFQELTQGDYLSGPSNQQPHEVYINESGLYCLILRSKKPEAKSFKRWVTQEVLPSIRRHGSYGGPALTSLTEQMQGLQGAIASLTQRLDAEPQRQVQHKVLSVAAPSRRCLNAEPFSQASRSKT